MEVNVLDYRDKYMLSMLIDNDNDHRMSRMIENKMCDRLRKE